MAKKIGKRRTTGLPSVMKDILLYAIIFLPFAILYNVLEAYLGDSWWKVAIIGLLLIVGRAALYFYRRSKGIKDTWPNDY